MFILFLFTPIVFLVFTYLIIKIIKSINKDYKINNKIYFYIIIQNILYLVLFFVFIRFIYIYYFLKFANEMM